MNQCFILRECTSEDVEAISELVLNIQQREFGVTITREEQPELCDPDRVFGSGNGCFYVVELFGRIVACAGLQDCGEGVGQIRKMFVAAPFRGQKLGLASRLMQRILVQAKERGFKRLYLGTVTRLERAIAFYRKLGFAEILKSELPAAVEVASVDDRAFKLELSSPFDAELGSQGYESVQSEEHSGKTGADSRSLMTVSGVSSDASVTTP